jgi:excisionase family DNA binding protein
MEIYTVPQAAEKLQVCELTLLRWLRLGHLQGSKVSRKAWRITDDHIREFLERTEVGAKRRKK